ncbi:MAG: hypothetical protein ACRDFX_12540 [Chloroflexota bacterium]
MEMAVAGDIYDRFFRELEGDAACGPQVAAKLRALRLEHQIQRESRILKIYREAIEDRE